MEELKQSLKTKQAPKEEVATAEAQEQAPKAEQAPKENFATSDLAKVLGSQYPELKLQNKMLKMHNVDVTLTIGKGSPTERKIFLSDLAGKIKRELGQ